jgi:hypothetical protein
MYLSVQLQTVESWPGVRFWREIWVVRLVQNLHIIIMQIMLQICSTTSFQLT